MLYLSLCGANSGIVDDYQEQPHLIDQYLGIIIIHCFSITLHLFVHCYFIAILTSIVRNSNCITSKINRLYILHTVTFYN